MAFEIIMKKNILSEKIKEHISKTAEQRDPAITAGSIYFMFKQYSVSIDNRSVYISILKEIKKHLLVHFKWRMVEVHDCFCKLHKLLKY